MLFSSLLYLCNHDQNDYYYTTPYYIYMNTSQTVTPPTREFSSYQILVIVILALTQFTVILDFMVMSPLGDMLMKSINMDTTQFSIVVSVYALSAALSGILTAGFADRFDRKKLLLFFYVGFILGTLFCGLSNNYQLLVVARVVTGLFGGVIGSISAAIMTDLFPIHQRGRVMGFMTMGFGASQVLGIPISLILANQWGWQSPFYMIVGFSLLILMVIVLKLQPVTQHLRGKEEQNALLHLFNTVRKNRYWAGYIATSFLSLGGFMIMPWGSAFAINNLHLTQQQLPILFMVAGVSTLIIMPLIGRISDKIDKYRLFVIASLWMMVMVVFYTHLTPVPLWVVIMTNILMMFGIMSRMTPSMALISALPDMHDRGAFMSINTSLQQLAGSIAAYVGGLIVYQADKNSPLQHFDTLGYVMVGVATASIFLLGRVNTIVSSQSKANPSTQTIPQVTTVSDDEIPIASQQV